MYMHTLTRSLGFGFTSFYRNVSHFIAKKLILTKIHDKYVKK